MACHVPRKHISLTDIQGCVPLMTIMSFIRGLSRKFLWGGGGGGGVLNMYGRG